jgi:hypothetical protein
MVIARHADFADLNASKNLSPLPRPVPCEAVGHILENHLDGLVYSRIKRTNFM